MDNSLKVGDTVSFIAFGVEKRKVTAVIKGFFNGKDGKSYARMRDLDGKRQYSKQLDKLEKI